MDRPTDVRDPAGRSSNAVRPYELFRASRAGERPDHKGDRT